VPESLNNNPVRKQVRSGRFPARLRSGDLVRVISPAGPVDADQLNAGVARLEEWGYRVEVSPYALSRRGYLAGKDSERFEDLIAALFDPGVSGVFCSRGGYGITRLMDRVPWEGLSRREPRVFVGFSDISAFQLMLWLRCGWVSFSGPQVAKGLGGGITPRTAAHLRGMVDGRGVRGSWPDGEPVILKSLQAGEVGGVLVPCCLSMLVSLIGTEYIPDLTNAILCLEDIGEPPYRLDRMFWQLAESGVLKEIAALVLGSFTWNDDEITDEVESIALDRFSGEPFPIWSGLPYGHIDDRLTLPVGAAALIESSGLLRLIPASDTLAI